jgi:hypothetical protein
VGGGLLCEQWGGGQGSAGDTADMRSLGAAMTRAAAAANAAADSDPHASAAAAAGTAPGYQPTQSHGTHAGIGARPCKVYEPRSPVITHQPSLAPMGSRRGVPMEPKEGEARRKQRCYSPRKVAGLTALAITTAA